MAKKAVAGFVRKNVDVAQVYKNYKPVVYRACSDVNLRRCDWDVVLNNVAIKFAEGRVSYDASRGAKPTTYFYQVALNCAKDEIRRQHPERLKEMEEKDWNSIDDERDNHAQLNESDKKFVVMEALRRLFMKVQDKIKFELLVKYLFNGESREKLASEYNVTVDYVSLQKTRYLPQLQSLVKEVWQEDEEGRLKLTSVDTSFLKPYIDK